MKITNSPKYFALKKVLERQARSEWRPIGKHITGGGVYGANPHTYIKPYTYPYPNWDAVKLDTGISYGLFGWSFGLYERITSELVRSYGKWDIENYKIHQGVVIDPLFTLIHFTDLSTSEGLYRFPNEVRPKFERNETTEKTQLVLDNSPHYKVYFVSRLSDVIDTLNNESVKVAYVFVSGTNDDEIEEIPYIWGTQSGSDISNVEVIVIISNPYKKWVINNQGYSYNSPVDNSSTPKKLYLVNVNLGYRKDIQEADICLFGKVQAPYRSTYFDEIGLINSNAIVSMKTDEGKNFLKNTIIGLQFSELVYQPYVMNNLSESENIKIKIIGSGAVKYVIPNANHTDGDGLENEKKLRIEGLLTDEKINGEFVLYAEKEDENSPIASDFTPLDIYFYPYEAEGWLKPNDEAFNVISGDFQFFETTEPPAKNCKYHPLKYDIQNENTESNFYLDLNSEEIDFETNISENGNIIYNLIIQGLKLSEAEEIINLTRENPAVLIRTKEGIPQTLKDLPFRRLFFRGTSGIIGLANRIFNYPDDDPNQETTTFGDYPELFYYLEDTKIIEWIHQINNSNQVLFITYQDSNNNTYEAIVKAVNPYQYDINPEDWERGGGIVRYFRDTGEQHRIGKVENPSVIAGYNKITGNRDKIYFIPLWKEKIDFIQNYDNGDWLRFIDKTSLLGNIWFWNWAEIVDIDVGIIGIIRNAEIERITSNLYTIKLSVEKTNGVNLKALGQGEFVINVCWDCEGLLENNGDNNGGGTEYYLTSIEPSLKWYLVYPSDYIKMTRFQPVVEYGTLIILPQEII